MPTSKLPVTPEDLESLIVPSQPRVSPDGTQVLYVRRTAGPQNTNATNLWMVPASGGPARALTSGDRDRHGRWSPDGDQIAFISDPYQGTTATPIAAC